MPSHSLFWGDGVFLRPQHFQQLEQRLQESLHIHSRWATPNDYGLHELSFDAESFANWRIVARKVHARLPDGTVLRFPEDCHLAAVAIPRHLFPNSEARVRVYVGVPESRKGVANTTEDPSMPVRFLQHQEEVEDENRAGNSQIVRFRKLNPCILIGEDAAKGFDAVPLFQLKVGATAEAPPQVDNDYIPPVLSQEAWEPLAAFFSTLVNRLGALSDQLARQMSDRGVSFESGHREDFERILNLHALNSALGGLTWIPSTRGLHPFVLYTELCRAVGHVAIFRKERKLLEVPAYDHDNLCPMFEELKRLLDGKPPETPYQRIPFAVQGLQMAVRLNSEWLAANWSFYIGVESTLRTGRVTELLTNARLMDMKAGSSEEVDSIYRFARRGVRFVPVGEAPRSFPRQNWHFFRVDRDDAWTSVERSLNFGIRFNERMVVQQVSGENKIDINDTETNGLATLAFSLFVIRNSEGS